MPSLMIHLQAAVQYRPQASTLFYIGNIAPDSTSDRFKKDHEHFRDYENRLEYLYEYGKKIDFNNDFEVGALLHLYLDYWWDTLAISEFIDCFKGDNWFPVYRSENALASSWLYYHKDYAKTVWKNMYELNQSEYKNRLGFDCDSIFAHLQRNYLWHQNNNVGPSTAFPPEYVQEFINQTVEKFKSFVKDIQG